MRLEKWVDDDLHTYCPDCAKKYRTRGPEPKYSKPGCDHCNMCGAEYFATPAGIVAKLRQAGGDDEYKLMAVKLLADWYELYPGYTEEFLFQLERILES